MTSPLHFSIHCGACMDVASEKPIQVFGSLQHLRAPALLNQHSSSFILLAVLMRARPDDHPQGLVPGKKSHCPVGYCHEPIAISDQRKKMHEQPRHPRDEPLKMHRGFGMSATALFLPIMASDPLSWYANAVNGWPWSIAIRLAARFPPC